jgi:hypothetical protein
MLQHVSKRSKKSAAADAVAARVLHVGQVSITGLHKILSRLKEASRDTEDFADLGIDVHRLRRVNLDIFMSVRHVEKMFLSGGGEFDWEFADPAKLMGVVLNRNLNLQDVYLRALAEHPCSPEKPWSIVVGFDEFVPGDKLHLDNRRKAMVLSFTFRELGQSAMTNGQAWFTAVILRTSKMAAIDGGWSKCLAVFLRRLLFGPVGGLATSGVAVDLRGTPTLIFGQITNFIGDGQGLMLAFGWKGHGGMKPCLKHHNVFKKDTLEQNYTHLLPVRPLGQPQQQCDFRSGHASHFVTNLDSQGGASKRACPLIPNIPMGVPQAGLPALLVSLGLGHGGPGARFRRDHVF